VRGLCTHLFILAVCLVAGSARAADNPRALLTEGLAHARRGDLPRARELLARAYRADSTDHRVLLACASVATDERSARRTLTGLASNTAADDSVRAAAHGLLGDLRAAVSDYPRAADHYRAALGLRPDNELKGRWGVAETDAGNYARAESLLTDVPPPAGQLLLANLRYRQRNFAAALKLYDKAAGAPKDSPWYVPATAGRALCSERLGYVTLAGTYRGKLEKQHARFLEEDLFAQGFTHLGKQEPRRAPAPARKTPPPVTPGPTYTVQVGSFSSPANAERLQERLSGELDDVRVVAARVQGRMYYRVRVGTFAKQEDAETFAQSRLRPRGLSYKVLSRE
jgi:tetratricopeptide (TPR) repeat protein